MKESEKSQLVLIRSCMACKGLSFIWWLHLILLVELLDGARCDDSEPCDTEVAVEEEMLPDLPVQDDEDESTVVCK